MNTKMTIDVNMDVRGALLLGRVVREWEPVEVSTEGLGDVWADMVLGLDMSVIPPRLRGLAGLVDGTESEIADRYRSQRSARDDADRATADRIDQMTAGLRLERSVIGPRIEGTEIVGWRHGETRLLGLTLADPNGVRLAGKPPVYAPTDGALARAAYDRYTEAIQSLELVVTRVNDDLLAARRSEWQSALDDAVVAEAVRQAKVRAEIAESEARRNAERLRTGWWEMETGSYNEKRLGKPWCALVTFPSGPKAQYEFGESSGAWGKAGVMRLQCRPGDVIAWGQRDLRRPDRSEHTLEVMQEDGSMREVTIAEAYKLTRGA